MSFMPIPSVVPTTLLLLGIGVACWRLGTIVVMGTRGQKLKAWADASLVTAVAAAIAFGWLQGVMANRFERAAVRVARTSAPTADVQSVQTSATTPDEIAWEPFSQRRLEQLISEGRTVFASPQPIVDALTRAQGQRSSAAVTQTANNSVGDMSHGS